MATITAKAQVGQQLGGTPYGNNSALPFRFQTNASGHALNSDGSVALAAAVGIGDVVRLGVIPAGAMIFDLIAVISNAFTSTSTCKLGFAYVDGVDDSAVPQSDAAFIATAQSIASAAVVRKTALVAPVRLPKDAYLILTNQVAAQAEAGIMDICLFGELGGGR